MNLKNGRNTGDVERGLGAEVAVEAEAKAYVAAEIRPTLLIRLGLAGRA